MVFTYSNVLALAAQARADLRSRLEHRIGGRESTPKNDATAVICTPA
jgi:hypothetical protein